MVGAIEIAIVLFLLIDILVALSYINKKGNIQNIGDLGKKIKIGDVLKYLFYILIILLIIWVAVYLYNSTTQSPEYKDYATYDAQNWYDKSYVSIPGMTIEESNSHIFEGSSQEFSNLYGQKRDNISVFIDSGNKEISVLRGSAKIRLGKRSVPFTMNFQIKGRGDVRFDFVDTGEDNENYPDYAPKWNRVEDFAYYQKVSAQYGASSLEIRDADTGESIFTPNSLYPATDKTGREIERSITLSPYSRETMIIKEMHVN
jgi:hypothetical protein